MANDSKEGLAYRMYEEYYARAKAAYQSGKLAEAKKMYLHAGEELLQAAREVKGETRSALIRRAENLVRLSDAIEIPRPVAAPPEAAGPGSGEGATGASAKGDAASMWTPSEKPNVHFDDIAGLAHVKEAVYTRVILPFKNPEVYAAFDSSRNSGILLYGPPGTGKTMIAKAIATEVDAPFYSVRCSDIVDKYFGESEKHVRALFAAARANDRAVLFFDEFEALAARRGTDSSVMSRLVPELLSQIDGFTTNPDKSLILLAATNRPWDLDTAFLRPPRLTEKIYVGLPDEAARTYLIERKLAKVPHDPSLNVAHIAALTEGFNSADVAEFCEYMKTGAIKRTIAAGGTAAMSGVCQADVDEAAKHVRSSVQQSDLINIQRWEQTQSGNKA